MKEPTPAQLAKYATGMRWEQKPDPDDADFAIITMRIPNEDHPTQTLIGAEASQRIIRFCQNTIQGAIAAAKHTRKRVFE